MPVVRDGKLVGIVPAPTLCVRSRRSWRSRAIASETGVGTPNEALRHRRDQAGR